MFYRRIKYPEDHFDVEKLKEKVERLQAEQNEMQNANAYYKKNKTMKGYGDMTNEEAEIFDDKIAKDDSWDKQPYTCGKLQFNNLSIYSTKKRIKELEKEIDDKKLEQLYNPLLPRKAEWSIEELQELKERLRLIHRDMINANEYYKKKGTMLGYGNMTNEEAEIITDKLKSGLIRGGQPYSDWHILNSYNSLNKVKERLLEMGYDDKQEYVYNTKKLGFKVHENKRKSLLQLFFNDEPKGKMYNELMKNGFVWSKKNECWQRTLNDDARFRLMVIMQLTRDQQSQTQKSGMEM